MSFNPNPEPSKNLWHIAACHINASGEDEQRAARWATVLLLCEIKAQLKSVATKLDEKHIWDNRPWWKRLIGRGPY